VAISLRLAAPPSNREILELSRRNPGLRFERRAAGDLVVTPTGSESGRREAKLVGHLDRWDTARGGGVVFGPSTGFHLPDGSLLSPDASWLHRERWEALTREEREGFAPLCPDAVFEVASRSDSLSALREKMQVYVANGARLAVLIDPKHRAVEVYSPDSAPRILEPAGPVSLDPVLSGFTLDPEPIFS
jgi:Uma2 family endonuclease